MKYPTTRVIYDRKKQASKTKKGLVQIEILFERKRKYISTGVKVFPDNWKEKTMVTGRFDSIELNDKISSILNNINTYINECIKGKHDFSFDALDKFLEVSSGSDSFLDFVEKRIYERQMKESTRKQHLVIFRKLQDFGIIQSFADLTVKNIKLFDDYIRKKISNQASVYSVHKRLKVYVKEAMQYEFLEKNPYDSFQVARGESSKRKYLTTDELNKIRQASIPNTSISSVRDCFVFCCFTGLAFSDLNKFDFEKNVVEVDGKFVIQDTRTKTDTPYNITLLSPAIEILKRYDYHLPKMTNQQYNMRLKLVGQYAEIEKELTSHMARHTFATWALSQGIRIEVVSKMLAHTNIKTTQIYAKILQEDVYKGFDELEIKLGTTS